MFLKVLLCSDYLRMADTQKKHMKTGPKMYEGLIFFSEQLFHRVHRLGRSRGQLKRNYRYAIILALKKQAEK